MKSLQEFINKKSNNMLENVKSLIPLVEIYNIFAKNGDFRKNTEQELQSIVSLLHVDKYNSAPNFYELRCDTYPYNYDCLVVRSYKNEGKTFMSNFCSISVQEGESITVIFYIKEWGTKEYFENNSNMEKYLDEFAKLNNCKLTKSSKYVEMVIKL